MLGVTRELGGCGVWGGGFGGCRGWVSGVGGKVTYYQNQFIFDELSVPKTNNSYHL